jgi:HEAT repeat protein
MSTSSARRSGWIVPIALVLVAAASAAQQANDDPLYRAYQAEVAQRDFAAADSLYAQAIAQLEKSSKDGKGADAIAKARVGRARCLAALGKKEEAKEQLLLVLQSKPDDKIARLELAKLTEPDAATQRIADRVQSMLGEMNSEAGDQRTLADFGRMGDVAVPGLAQALRDEDVTIVVRAAKAIAWIETPASWQALAAALSDPQLLYPGAIGEALVNRCSTGLRVTSTTLPAILALLSRMEEDLRWSVAEALIIQPAIREGEPAASIEVVQRLLRDDSERIRDRAAQVRCDDVGDALVPVVQRMLDATDAAERRRAATLIACNTQSLPRPALDELIDRIKKDRDPQIRMNAHLAEFHRHRNESNDLTLAADSVLALLADEDPQVFAAGVSQIDSIRDVLPESAHELFARAVARCLEDPALSDETRTHVAKRVDRYHLTEDELVELFIRAGKAKLGWSDAKVDELRSQLARLVARSADKGDFDLRAAEVLRRIPDAKGRRIWFQRWAGKETANLVRVAASDDDVAVRRLAYSVGLPAVSVDSTELPHLAEDLPQIDEKSLMRLFESLRATPNPALVAPLRAIHAKARGDLENLSLRVLGFSGGKEATPDLLASLRSKKPCDPYLCLDLLSKDMGEQEVVRELVAAAQRHGSAQTVVMWLNWESAGQRAPASLAESFVRQVPPELLRMYAFRQVASKLPLDLLRERVTAALRGADREEQRDAAALAGEYRLDFTWDDLARLLDSGDGGVRLQAMESLQKLREYRELRGATAAGDSEARRAAIEKATAMAKNPDVGQRIAAALAFGALGDVSAVAPLLDLATDADASVRLAAQKALEKLQAAPAPPPAAPSNPEKKKKDGTNR